MTITPESRYLISGSEDRSIMVIDIIDKIIVHLFKNAHEGKV